ncbi:homeobox-DDT domain protein RLT2 isoform X1 [Coffea eugenioides]|uniref:homeobox-DDT domain protein RLT2 isoform X1 n=1 Tax=Coffea eugenioides TaxID=49369 RepID=UPI000F60F656|nr:homeobox-DDT domain protein RLT2 isoform X1 [Coffea eugenioides]
MFFGKDLILMEKVEVDGGGSGGSAVAAAADAGAEGGGYDVVKKNSTPEGEPRVKRKMKTPSQLEVLEKAYSVDTYPSEAMRAELAMKLGLTDRQLQMWFCHRRLKDRKPPGEKRVKKEASPGMVGALSNGVGKELVGGYGGGMKNDQSLGLVRTALGPTEILQQHRVVHRSGTALARIGTEMPAVKRYYEPPQALSELRAIAFVEAQLGERLREDGPVLGMEFDPLPPGAFGSPIGLQKPGVGLYEAQVYETPDAKVIQGAKRTIHEYQFLPEQPSIRDDIRERALPFQYYGSSTDAQSSRTTLSAGRSFMHGTEQLTPGYSFQGKLSGGPCLSLLPQLGNQGHHLSPPSGEVDIFPQRNSVLNIDIDRPGAHLTRGLETPLIPTEKRVIHDEERLERKRKSEEARIARDVEAHEKRIRKELEKQDLLRRKRDEQLRKEMERQDKERRKEEERLLREKQREEERYQREQRREMERREKFLQKESIRAEKMRLKLEMRREKEAARLKAATERATARRIAKESVELIDDERLELLELAASSQGLPSTLALDNEALQNLESHRDSLTEFPPKTVCLKRPFGMQPWVESEESVGSILMIWRFLITFADVLGLWPFTLDEIVQAFHDYDSRLLGEIHIALLRIIIRDIEDIARTPATAVGANQNAAIPGGGHPQIVEGAYSWGFDILSWHQHLNPLTWPEILRQFALAAGFGPKLKRRNVEQSHPHDENEGKDGIDIIAGLRNGAAAENAVAKMRQRGISNLGRSRHRLTPGTVKYAAFHVLSLEGSKGLTILEAVDKIQNSGLRDLTTSKTPEASVAAALSRDTKLFERTAPSTYCVRAPYRKDPADAEAILATARERIFAYKNEFLDAEEPDEAEKEDAERDEDSESDMADDPDINDLDTERNLNKESLHSFEPSTSGVKHHSGNIKEKSHVQFTESSGSSIANTNGSFDIVQPEGMEGASGSQSAATVGIHIEAANNEDNVIDESSTVELWVQGLTEGDYSDLSVEERLDALVALIGVANEGNSIRVVLEERLEAANALKKQMWAEAQLDKRRVKEEYALKVQSSSFAGSRSEQNSSITSSDGRQNTFLNIDGRNESLSTNPKNHQMDLGDSSRIPNSSASTTAERNMMLQEFSGPDVLLQQSAYAAEKSRLEMKAYIGQKAEEIYVYKSVPLGQDRRRNRYWQFIASPSQNDPGSGRIFVELHDGRWRLIDSAEGFDGLLASLDVRGTRESHLHSMLQRIEVSFKETAKKNLCSRSTSQDADDVKEEVSEESPNSMVSDMMEPLASIRIKCESYGLDKNVTLERYRDFEKWMWDECFSIMKLRALKYGKTLRTRLLSICSHCHDLYFFENQHCPFCHKNCSILVGTFNFGEHVSYCKEKQEEVQNRTLVKLEPSSPLRIRLLKAQLASLEASLLPEAVKAFWSEDYRRSWGMKLEIASSAEDLLQILSLLENAVKRDFLVPDYETANELLGFENLKGGMVDNTPTLEMTAVLPWIPQTTSAVALRLMDLDTSICYTLQQKDDSEKVKGARHIIRIPTRNTGATNAAENVRTERPQDAGTVPEDTWDGPGAKLNSSRRAHRQVARPQRRVSESRNGSGQGTSAAKRDKFGPLLGWKGRPNGRGGRKRGRRTVRSRQNPTKKRTDIASKRASAGADIYDKTPSSYQHEWDEEGTTQIQAEVAGNESSSERSGFDDDNDLMVEDYSGCFGTKSENLAKGIDYGMGVENGNDELDDDEEDDEEEADERPGEQVVEEYFDSDSEEDANISVSGEKMGNLNKGSEFSSSDYSD